MLPVILMSACLNISFSNPTLGRDVRRWSLDIQEQKHDLKDLKQRIDMLDARVTDQLNRRVYSSGVNNVK